MKSNTELNRFSLLWGTFLTCECVLCISRWDLYGKGIVRFFFFHSYFLAFPGALEFYNVELEKCFPTHSLSCHSPKSNATFSERPSLTTVSITAISVHKLSLTITNTWDYEFVKRKGLFWFTVLWVFAHNQLFPLLWGLWWGSTPWWEHMVEWNCSPMAREWKRERGRDLMITFKNTPLMT
jgi:hypothetical protein